MIRRTTAIIMALLMAGIGLRFVEFGMTKPFWDSLGYYGASLLFFGLAASMIRAIIRAIRNHGMVL